MTYRLHLLVRCSVYTPISIGLVGNSANRVAATNSRNCLHTDFDRVSWKPTVLLSMSSIESCLRTDFDRVSWKLELLKLESGLNYCLPIVFDRVSWKHIALGLQHADRFEFTDCFRSG